MKTATQGKILVRLMGGTEDGREIMVETLEPYLHLYSLDGELQVYWRYQQMYGVWVYRYYSRERA